MLRLLPRRYAASALRVVADYHAITPPLRFYAIYAPTPPRCYGIDAALMATR